MALQNSNVTRRDSDRMMLDSGTSSHMTPYSENVQSKNKCNVSVTLADASRVNAESRGIRSVKWCTEIGKNRVRLPDTLVVPNMSTSLHFVPALMKKTLPVIFMPEKAVLTDLENHFSFSVTPHHSKRVYFICLTSGIPPQLYQLSEKRIILQP